MIQLPVIFRPSAEFATTAIYGLNRKQYIAIACGADKLKITSGDSYIAFALPAK
jgi:quinoprotein glucose dehydrogenase